MDKLPRGFNGEELKIPKRCRLGNLCDDSKNTCSIHKWIYFHEDAYWGLIILGVCVVAACLIGTSVYYVNMGYNDITTIIEGYNCNQLTEYIADKSRAYTYAIHRYEWLCITEQTKEFGG